jgi:hypothetical protein
MTCENRKGKEISCSEVLDVFFCWLKASPVAWTFLMDAQGPGISKLQYLIKRNRY